MTDEPIQKEQLDKELAHLRNFSKFVTKYIELMAYTALDSFNGKIEPSKTGEHCTIQLKKLIDGYPGQIEGVSEDMLFYLGVLKRLRTATILLGLEEVITECAKKQNEQNIEQALNDLLGFK